MITGKCEALYDFQGDDDKELSFQPGDIIITSEWVNEEWMKGRMGEKEGIFPIGFVKILEELPKIKKEEKPKAKGSKLFHWTVFVGETNEYTAYFPVPPTDYGLSPGGSTCYPKLVPRA